MCTEHRETAVDKTRMIKREFLKQFKMLNKVPHKNLQLFPANDLWLLELKVCITLM